MRLGASRKRRRSNPFTARLWRASRNARQNKSKSAKPKTPNGKSWNARNTSASKTETLDLDTGFEAKCFRCPADNGRSFDQPCMGQMANCCRDGGLAGDGYISNADAQPSAVARHAMRNYRASVRIWRERYQTLKFIKTSKPRVET